jgi:hypothetical protein
MGSSKKVSGPMVLVAALTNGHKRSNGLGGRVKAMAGRLGFDGSDGVTGNLERAGEILSAAAVAIAVLARVRSESNGGGE